MRLSVLPRVNVCASSCQKVEPQLNGPASFAAGESNASVVPKLTPSAPRPASPSRRCAPRNPRDCDRSRSRIGRRRRVRVLSCANVAVRLLGQFLEVDGKDGRFILLDQELKVLARKEVVVLIGIEQVERVLHPHAVRIAGERRLEARSALRHSSETQFVVPEHRPGVPVLGIERHTLLREVGRSAYDATAPARPARPSVAVQTSARRPDSAPARAAEPSLQ